MWWRGCWLGVWGSRDVGSGLSRRLLESRSEQSTDPVNSSGRWGVWVVAAVAGPAGAVASEVAEPAVIGCEAQMLEALNGVGASSCEPALDTLVAPVFWD